VPGPADTLSLSGNLSGSGSLAKIGDGVLILSGNNNYAGGTEVQAGTLEISSAAALPDGTSLSIATGGTFVFDPTAAVAPFVPSPAAVVAVPEPGTLALLAAGLVVGIGMTWRKRKNTKTPL